MGPRPEALDLRPETCGLRHELEVLRHEVPCFHALIPSYCKDSTLTLGTWSHLDTSSWSPPRTTNGREVGRRGVYSGYLQMGIISLNRAISSLKQAIMGHNEPQMTLNWATMSLK